MNARTEQLIELYFANELSEPETRELRSLLQQDASARAEFEWQRGLAGQVSRLSLSGSIQNTGWREAARPPFRTVTMMRRIMAAAAALAALVVAWYVLTPQKTDDVVAGNYVHYPNKMPFRSLGGPTDKDEKVPQDVLDAFRLYDNAERPADAARALAGIVTTYPERLDYRFYYGVALVGDKQYAAAATALQPVTAAENTYKTPAFYYLGLALAGAGDQPGAARALHAYLDTPGEVLTYREQAANVLKSVEK